MAQEIYNEGRVVGLSAWELFKTIAEAQGVDPDNIPDEREWLAAMIGSGASMVLKIPSTTSKGIHDYELPSGSNLSAAGVIVANPFLGDCTWDENDTWATKVTSYSSLISNISTSSPSSSTVPSGTYSPDAYSSMLTDFMKITDGIVFTKSADWIQTPDEDGNPGVPYKDIDPDFPNSTTVVRLYIDGTLNSDVYILLTGFKNKYMLQCFAGHAYSDGATPPRSECGSTDITKNEYINGGMLGPKVIPWASKIVFSVPSTLYNLANSLTRTIPSDTTYTAKTVGGITFKDINSTVKTTSFIDFNSINLGDYYTVHSSEYSVAPTLQENVSTITLGASNSYNSIVAWYPGMTAAKIAAATDASKIFPPAIYGAYINSTGTQTLVPLDTAAPGTIKGFKNSTQAYNYTQSMPYNYAVYYNTSDQTFTFVTPSQSDPTQWSGSAKIEYLNTAPRVKVTAGSKSAKFISLTKSDGTDYAVTGTSGTMVVGPSGNLKWADLLTIMTNNNSIDLLGNSLSTVGAELESQKNIGMTSIVNNVGVRTSLTIQPTDNSKKIELTSNTDNGKVLKISSGAGIKSGTQFIEFANGMRLFISNSAPTSGMKNGDIGIGW